MWCLYMCIVICLSGVRVEGVFPPSGVVLPDFSVVENQLCRVQGEAYKQALGNFTLWAVQMFDASAKFPSSLLTGNGYELGNFDECLDVGVETKVGRVEGQYCLVDVHYSAKVKYPPQYTLYYNPLKSAWLKLRDSQDPTQIQRNTIHWALCVPSTCTSSDVQQALSWSMSNLKVKFNFNSTVLPDLCQSRSSIQEKKRYNFVDKFTVALAVCITLLVLVSSLFDEVQSRTLINSDYNLPPEPSLYLLFKCFSVRRNLSYLTQTTLSNTGLDCIHGLRLLFMVLTISGHRFMIEFSGPILNADIFEESYRHFSNMYVLNGLIVMDSFFVYSGLLTAYYLPLELEDKKGLNPCVMWLYRFIRLTPVYFAVLLFHATLLGKMGSGPLWPNTIGLQQQRCYNNWWLNLFYLNNYINAQHMCMYQSWYLSVDTHLFMLAVLVVYLMWKKPNIGYSLLTMLGFLSVAVPFVVTYITSADPFMLFYPNVVKDLPSSEHFHKFYAASHMRAGPYFVGVAIGFILYKTRETSFSIPKGWLHLGHLSCILICILSQYSGYIFYRPGIPYLPLSSALYSATHRTLWGCAIGLNVFLLMRGRIDWLHNLLTWRPIIPLSRLTYCAYLLHTVPHLYEVATLRSPQTISYYTGIWMFVGDIFFTFGLSLLFYLTIEAPFRNIERLIFGIRIASAQPKDSSEVNPTEKMA